MIPQHKYPVELEIDGKVVMRVAITDADYRSIVCAMKLLGKKSGGAWAVYVTKKSSPKSWYGQMSKEENQDLDEKINKSISPI